MVSAGFSGHQTANVGFAARAFTWYETRRATIDTHQTNSRGSTMRHPARAVVVACGLGLVAAAAFATVGEKVQAVGKAASGVATKTENAVKRGVKAAASGVEHGAKAAGNAVTAGAKKIGVPGAGASSPKAEPSR
jgi:hypothetical protein